MELSRAGIELPSRDNTSFASEDADDIVHSIDQAFPKPPGCPECLPKEEAPNPEPEEAKRLS